MDEEDIDDGCELMVDEVVYDMYRTLFRRLDDVEDEEEKERLLLAVYRRMWVNLSAELNDEAPEEMYG